MTSPLPRMYPGGMRIGREEEEAVLEALRSSASSATRSDNRFALGSELEDAFAAVMGVQHAAAVTSGSAPDVRAGRPGVGPGDEVIVPAYTWIASASAGGNGSRRSWPKWMSH